MENRDLISDAPENNVLVIVAMLCIVISGVLLDNGYACTALAFILITVASVLLLWVRHERGLFM